MRIEAAIDRHAIGLRRSVKWSAGSGLDGEVPDILSHRGQGASGTEDHARGIANEHVHVCATSIVSDALLQIVDCRYGLAEKRIEKTFVGGGGSCLRPFPIWNGGQLLPDLTSPRVRHLLTTKAIRKFV